MIINVAVVSDLVGRSTGNPRGVLAAAARDLVSVRPLVARAS
jgi:hypothetical protein